MSKIDQVSKAASWHPVPVRLVDEVMPHLKDTELRVLLVVLRQTSGWKADRAETGPGRRAKRRDWLSHHQLCRRTGRGSDAVSGAVASLTAAGLIVVEDAAGNLLPTPEERRRCLSRLYYRPGEIWTGKDVQDASWESIDLWKSGKLTAAAVRENQKQQHSCL